MGILCAAAKCQTMCGSKYAQGKVSDEKKVRASTPTHLFMFVCCVCVHVGVSAT